MRRRTLLFVLGGGTLSMAGCTTGTDVPEAGDGTGERTDVPRACPTSRHLGVDWPEDVDAATVEAFVEEYEHVYYRDIVVEYEPESRLDSYELSGRVTDPPREAGDGWTLHYSGGGGVYRPTLLMGATPSDPPEGADVVQSSEIECEPLTGMLEDAAENGEAEHHVDRPGSAVDRYVDLVASLSDDAGRLSGRGDSETLYVAVEDTTVELSVSASDFHGDYGWEAWYYVDGHVVRRTTDGATDPRDGDLLECRKSG